MKMPFAASLALFLLAPAFVPGPATADCLEYGDYIHSLGFLELPCGNYCAAVSGHYLLVGGNSWLNIVDVADPHHPRHVGSAPTGNLNLGVVVSADYAYVADYQTGLQVVELNLGTGNPPQVVSTIYFGGDALGVALAEARPFVYVAGPGLQVIDIRYPENPLMVGRVAVEGARCVAASDDYAYVAGNTFFYVVDVSEPANPRIVGQQWVGSVGLGLAVWGNYVCHAGTGGFLMIDVSDPHAPQVTATVALDGYGWSVAVSGRRAYVASRALQVIDLSDPKHPTVIGSEHTNGNVYGVAAAGNRAYTAMGGGAADGGMQVFDITHPESPPIMGGVDIPDVASAVSIRGNLAYIAGDAGLQIIDNSDPTNPTMVGNLHTLTYLDLALWGTKACAVGHLGTGGLDLIDVEDPGDPRIVGTIQTGEVTSVAASGGYAYVAGWANVGFLVIDLRESTRLAIVGQLELPGAYRPGMAVSGSHAYVAGDVGLQVIDVAEPSQPRWVGSLDTGNSSDVAVSGDYAYVYGGSRLHAVDIRDPQLPRIVDSVELLGSGAEVAVCPPYAYVLRLDWWAGLVQVVDISDPEHPWFVGSIDTGQACAVAASDALVCGAGYQYQNLWPQCARSNFASSDAAVPRELLGVNPNPSCGPVTIRLDTRRCDPVRVGIYDLAGRRIRELSDATSLPETSALLWDGRDESGRAVPAGIYLARIGVAADGRTARVIIVR